MLDKETYKKELVRMWDSLRNDKYKGTCNCYGVKCEQCPLCQIIDDCCNETMYFYDAVMTVKKWSKEHPPKKYKISQLEYDILEEANSTNVRFGFYIHIRNLLLKGYFKGATSDMLINDYLDNCEVEEK